MICRCKKKDGYTAYPEPTSAMLYYAQPISDEEL